MSWARGGAVALVLRYARRLRFPALLVVTVVLLAIDFVLPDPFPLVDEIALALLALLLATWRKRDAPEEPSAEPPPRPLGERD